MLTESRELQKKQKKLRVAYDNFPDFFRKGI